MKKSYRILLADNTTEFGKTCLQKLKEKEMEVYTCAKDGKELLENIANIKPDVVISDLFLPNMDLIGVACSVNNSVISSPLFIGITATNNAVLEKEILSSGIAYLFIKPVDIDLLSDRIIQLLSWRIINNPSNSINVTQRNTIFRT